MAQVVMLQAIVTTYHGPTDHKGSRIIARASAGSKTFPYDHRLNTDDNHKAAARAYAEALHWDGELVSGTMYDARVAHVFTGGLL